MRVLLDTNVFISYLLSPSRTGTIVRVVEWCLAEEDVELLVPGEQLEELRRSVHRSVYLSQHIRLSDLTAFLESLKEAAYILPPLESKPPARSRDPDDDYLLLYGLLYQGDYLVTGDQDLLVLKAVENLQIITPARFLDIA